jgi:hypothetical protein
MIPNKHFCSHITGRIAYIMKANSTNWLYTCWLEFVRHRSQASFPTRLSFKHVCNICHSARASDCVKKAHKHSKFESYTKVITVPVHDVHVFSVIQSSFFWESESSSEAALGDRSLMDLLVAERTSFRVLRRFFSGSCD